MDLHPSLKGDADDSGEAILAALLMAQTVQENLPEAALDFDPSRNVAIAIAAPETDEDADGNSWLLTRVEVILRTPFEPPEFDASEF